MTRIGLSLLLLLTAGMAQAELYETRHADGSVSYSDTAAVGATRHNRAIKHSMEDGQLPGVWQAEQSDGEFTQLTLRDDGSFVLDQRSTETLHRLYMCGTWADAEDALALNVKALKRRLESGETEQAANAFQSRAEILSARRDRIILQFEGQQLVFNRS